MRFWFQHSSDVPLHDQIVTQVSLGILSGELAPGERLPSIRELARRFHIHPNTVSLAYRRLERESWVELRRGSGVYVRASTPSPAHSLPTEYLDRLIANLVQTARTLNLSPEELSERLQAALNQPAPATLLLIEPDHDLQNIILAELALTATLPIRTTGLPLPPPGPELTHLLAGAIAVVLPSKAEAVRADLPSGTPLVVLRIRSVPLSLAEWLPAKTDSLVAVVSHWPQFLETARVMLIAAGFHADALLLRDAHQPNWTDGLGQTTGVICDAFTAAALPSTLNLIPFRLLADETLEVLRHR
jgi:DNA-binding transcriptional regulator YhcF (GntR family)